MTCKENVDAKIVDALTELDFIVDSREKALVKTKLQEAQLWLTQVKGN